MFDLLHFKYYTLFYTMFFVVVVVVMICNFVYMIVQEVIVSQKTSRRLLGCFALLEHFVL